MEENALNALEVALQEEQARINATAQRLSEQLGKVHEVLGEFTRDLDAQQGNAENFGAPLTQHFEALRVEIAEAQGGDPIDEQELLSLSAAVLDWEERYNALEKEQGEGQAAVEASRERVTTLEQELSDACTALNATENEVANLNEILEEKQQAASETQTTTTALQEHQEQQEQRLAELETEKAELAASLDTSAQEKNTLEETLEKAREQLRQNEDELEQLRGTVESVEAGAQEQQEQDEAARRQLEQDSQQKAEQATEDLSATQSKIQELEEALQASQAKEAEPGMEADLRNARRETGIARDELRTAHQTLDQLKQLLGNGLSNQVVPKSASANEIIPIPVYEPEEIDSSTRNTMARVQEVSAQSGKRGKTPLGQLLIEAEAVTEEELEEAFQDQKNQPNKHLGLILVEKGFVKEAVLAQALAAQSRTDLVHLDTITIEDDAPGLITERLARQHQCIPISATPQQVVLAIVNPLDLVAIEDVERATNRRTEVVVATPKSIEWALQEHYATTPV